MTDHEFLSAFKAYAQENLIPPPVVQPPQDKHVAYSVKKAAEVLCVSVPTLYELVHAEGFPSYKVGGKLFIDAQGLREWSARNAAERVGYRR